jgi:hypothetical protein
VLAMGMLALVGCRQSQSVGVDVSPVPPPRPFVFFDGTDDPSERMAALSEPELKEIIDWVATQTSDPIWLIRVRPSTITKTRKRMVAYIVPDEATTRIRAGRAYYIPASDEKTGSGVAWRYAQVSMPDHAFTEQLTKPSVTEVPFEWPVVADPSSRKTSPMPKEEVVSVVDFVRHRALHMGIRGILQDRAAARESAELPILKIRREGEAIGVTFGYLHEPLLGGGARVTIKRTRSGYKVSDWSLWVS